MASRRRRSRQHNLLLLLRWLFLLCLAAKANAGTWCVVRSDATQQAVQQALDYACGSGADCAPIQSSGLCFLPNTLQGHASYAFNSYYQRKGMAPGSCDFAGTATVAASDPSYGSCVYPSSMSTAGGSPTTGTGTGTGTGIGTGMGTSSTPGTTSTTPTTSFPTVPTGSTLTPPSPTYIAGGGEDSYSESSSSILFLASTISACVISLMALL